MMKKSWLAAGLLAAALSVSVLPSFAVAEETFELDMRGVDIREFINTVSKLTGKTIVVDERVKGDVNIKSPRQLSRSELYEVFLLQLGVSGFSVVDMGSGILKVIPNQAAKIEGIEVQVDGDEPLQSESIITRIVQVQNVDVDKLIPSLRPLIDNRTGVITPYSASNVILITDRESNVRRLLQIIQQVDRADSQSMETVPLTNASAKELERILTKLINDQAKEQGTPKPIITSDLRTNTLVIFGDNNSRAYLKRLIRELDSEVKTSSNVRVHYLRYAKAEEMVPVLKSVSEAMLKQEGEREAVSKSNINIEAHEQTNSVVLSGSPHIIRNLADVISSLDIRRAQVLVEAIIVELSDSRAKELGVQWLFRGDQSGTAPIGGVNLPLQGAPGIFGVATGASAGGEALTSALSGLTGMSIGVGKIRENSFSFGALLRAISTDTETNILSTPSLLTLDNQEASILVGSEIPVITGATASSNNNNPFQTITRQEIGVKLTVTPQINEGDAVMMRLEQEVSSISNDPTPTADVVTNKRTINTSVLVNDGQTIVLGGLIDDTIQEISSKVPILGSMPIIGRLFRADKTQKSKSNLMVFIRPTIVRDSETLKGLSSEKYNYIRAQQLILHNDGINLFPAAKAPVLPVWTGLDPSPAGMLPELEAEVDPNDMPED